MPLKRTENGLAGLKATYDLKVGQLLLIGPGPASFFIAKVVASLRAIRAVSIFENKLLLSRIPVELGKSVAVVIHNFCWNSCIENPKLLQLWFVSSSHEFN